MNGKEKKPSDSDSGNSSPQRYKIHDLVEAKYTNDEEAEHYNAWFDAQIIGNDDPDVYNIVWCDDTGEDIVPSSNVRLRSFPDPGAVVDLSTSDFRKGQEILANKAKKNGEPGFWFSARVEHVGLNVVQVSWLDHKEWKEKTLSLDDVRLLNVDARDYKERLNSEEPVIESQSTPARNSRRKTAKSGKQAAKQTSTPRGKRKQKLFVTPPKDNKNTSLLDFGVRVISSSQTPTSSQSTPHPTPQPRSRRRSSSQSQDAEENEEFVPPKRRRSTRPNQYLDDEAEPQKRRTRAKRVESDDESDEDYEDEEYEENEADGSRKSKRKR